MMDIFCLLRIGGLQRGVDAATTYIDPTATACRAAARGFSRPEGGSSPAERDWDLLSSRRDRRAGTPPRPPSWPRRGRYIELCRRTAPFRSARLLAPLLVEPLLRAAAAHVHPALLADPSSDRSPAGRARRGVGRGDPPREPVPRRAPDRRAGAPDARPVAPHCAGARQ